MAKIKHIALSTQDPEKTARFYCDVFGMKQIGRVDHATVTGYFLTDGDSIPRYAFSGSLEGHGHWVVYGSESFAWEHANARSAVGLSSSRSSMVMEPNSRSSQNR